MSSLLQRNLSISPCCHGAAALLKCYLSYTCHYGGFEEALKVSDEAPQLLQQKQFTSGIRGILFLGPPSHPLQRPTWARRVRLVPVGARKRTPRGDTADAFSCKKNIESRNRWCNFVHKMNGILGRLMSTLTGSKRMTCSEISAPLQVAR